MIAVIGVMECVTENTSFLDRCSLFTDKSFVLARQPFRRPFVAMDDDAVTECKALAWPERVRSVTDDRGTIVTHSVRAYYVPRRRVIQIVGMITDRDARRAP